MMISMVLASTQDIMQQKSRTELLILMMFLPMCVVESLGKPSAENAAAAQPVTYTSRVFSTLNGADAHS